MLDSFGEDRGLGGDWLRCTAALSSLGRTLDALTASLTPVAKRKLWNENVRCLPAWHPH